jgi:hypothetical protein
MQRNDVISTVINEHTRELLHEVEWILDGRGNKALADAVRDLRLDIDRAIELLKETA